MDIQLVLIVETMQVLIACSQNSHPSGSWLGSCSAAFWHARTSGHSSGGFSCRLSKRNGWMWWNHRVSSKTKLPTNTQFAPETWKVIRFLENRQVGPKIFRGFHLLLWMVFRECTLLRTVPYPLQSPALLSRWCSGFPVWWDMDDPLPRG